MEKFLLITSIIFAITTVILTIKIFIIKRGAKEISQQFTKNIKGDTNALINTSCSDKDISNLACTLNAKISDLREKELTFSNGDKELKSSITNIAHDIRTPLTAICGYLDMIRDGCSQEDLEKYLDIMRERANALKLLSEELFKFSVVADTPQIKEEKVNVSMVLQETLFSFYERFSQRGILPQIYICDTAMMRFTDKNALVRIFSNLIDNAIKYSCGDFSVRLENGKITFSNTTYDLDTVSVGKLFDRFYTVQDGNNSTGLGLSIAKLLTKKLGGEISAHLENNILNITLII